VWGGWEGEGALTTVVITTGYGYGYSQFVSRQNSRA